jgi:hypothetical protein
MAGPILLEEYTNLRLDPKQFPQDARVDCGRFGNSLTIARGTVLGKRTSDGKLYAYSNSQTDGTETAVAISMYDIVTDASGNVYLGTSAVPSHSNLPFMGSTIYIAGTFATTDLTGWDSNALADLGARTLPNGLVRIP